MYKRGETEPKDLIIMNSFASINTFKKSCSTSRLNTTNTLHLSVLDRKVNLSLSSG